MSDNLNKNMDKVRKEFKKSEFYNQYKDENKYYDNLKFLIKKY